MGKARVFVLQGYYGTGNFGDDWLLSAAIGTIARAAPGARFVVRDHGDAVPLDGAGQVIFTGSERVLSNQTMPRLSRLRRYVTDAWRQFGGADWLVFGGGTQFHGSGGTTSLALNALLCILARLRGVRVAALGIGVKGTESAAARALLAVIVRCSSVFAVRDEASQSAAGNAAIAGADLAFTAPLPPPARHGGAIAVAVYPHAWSTSLADSLAAALQGREVVLLEVQRAGVTEGDGQVLDMLSAGLPGSERRRMVPDGSSFDGVGLVCGMRFHALLAAAQAGLPFVGIAHDPKIADLCARFAMPCLAPERATADAIAAAIADGAGRSPSPEALARCIEEARRGPDALARALA
ncbi:polysaccharide pyruvyl transferase family protein [Elioraea rosea]|uniref:polysaccharide pyruvyl transferase family protein n=1 Tax=Elioraea rosea TaxID=2492390 RepID=UPI001183185C|nr:polysaccharide pyruvyl transferase family protein [Elioraea rosea]